MKFILQRIGQGLIVIFAALTLAFILMFVIGDPVTMITGVEASREQADQLREQLGFNRPLILQYFEFMVGAAQGDFGVSYRHQQPVLPLLWERLGRSAEIALPALILALAVSIPAGIMSALRRNSAIDYGTRVTALVGQAAPNFWVGIMMIILFANVLGWLPSSGREIDGGLWKQISHMIMPTITLALLPMAYLTRMMRSTMLEVINEDYIRTARAKGASVPRVVYIHALRNALIPYVTITALQIGNLIAGSMVVESVFAWPGMGRLLMDSIRTLDIPVVAAGLSFVAALFVVLNLIADVCYALLDPRVGKS
ncbi:ABC transporter permease [Yoonia sp.]|uniref:ABC transporter permease n=1 Tax=Yoonia sp. TaxID=2212373 RepID=UPI003A4D22DD